jgi:5-oxoprolinase (ATP-hydrolysing)
VKERIRPIKTFENDKKEVVVGINQERYVVDQLLDLAHVETELNKLHKDLKFDSLAVVLMHSYACPESELKIGEIARKVGFSQVSLSHQIMQRIKLVKRG